MRYRRFEGRRVLVTGAAGGIGRRIAERFHDEGADVIGLDRQGRDEYLPYRLLGTDVADPGQVERVSNHIRAENRRIDVLVNAAGVLRIGQADTLSVDDWTTSMAVNAGGPFFLMRQWMPVFREQRYGAIVNIASNAARVPRMHMAVYCASKAALVSLSHSIGLELAPFGVRCNVVSPGSTDTPMLAGVAGNTAGRQRLISGLPEQFRLGIPLGKIAVPDDIADTVLFLASDQAGHITLQDIVIDGGATLAA